MLTTKTTLEPFLSIEDELKNACQRIREDMERKLLLSDQIKEYLDFIEECEYAGGEITPSEENRLNLIMNALTRKIDSCKNVLDRLESDEERYVRMASQLMERAGQCRDHKNRLQNYILNTMKINNLDSLTGETYKFKIVKNPPAVHIVDVNKIAPVYKITRQETTIDKMKIKEDIQNGKKVEGAELRQGERIKDYINET